MGCSGCYKKHPRLVGSNSGNKAGISAPVPTELGLSESPQPLPGRCLTWPSLHVSYVPVYILIPSSKGTNHVGLALARVPNAGQFEGPPVSVTPFSLGTRFPA